jgi:hypothetical protein
MVVFMIVAIFGWLAMLKAIKEEKSIISFRKPLLYVLSMFIINSAMNAQYIYTVELSGIDNASSGTMVLEYLIFFLTWLSAILYCEGFLITKLLSKGKNKYLIEKDSFRKYILFPGLALCFVMCVFFRSNVKESFAYQAYEYVKSGQAADYKEQIAEYMVILLDDSVEEAYLKPINNKQGPLTHWTVMEDEDNFVNWAYKEFYRKKKVVIVSQ